jgi:lon-related putative ATP-dependent protease
MESEASKSLEPLAAQQLRRRIDPDCLGVATTADLEPVSQLIGQERAVEAVRFGMAIRRQGYNLFVLGPSGMGKHTLVRGFLRAEAAAAPPASDWCYVHNFEQPDKPRALRLAPGRGSKLRDSMRKLAEESLAAITATFESEEFGERERKAFQALGDEAQQEGIALVHTPAGFAFAPLRGGAVINPEEYEKLPEDERNRISATIEQLQEKLQRIIRQVPQWGRERRNRLKELHHEFTTLAVDHLVAELEAEYADLPQVVAHLAAVRRDLIDTAAQPRQAEGSAEGPDAGGEQTPAWLRRYQVNLIVGQGDEAGAPVVIEDNPTYQNLVGRVEYLSHFGALVTDFNLIKPGSLHQANGGYLMIDAHKLLMQPLAWDALKRALVSRRLHINSIGQMMGLVSTVSLDPESIPLDVKVVLFGERSLYYLLYEWDPDFRELFKVAADFEETVDLDEQTLRRYARLIATVARNEDMLDFDAAACAQVLEHIVRLSGDRHKLSTHMQSLADLMREADHLARAAGRTTVDAASVAAAIAAQERRSDRVKLRMQDSIREGVMRIETTGARVGQVNGLSVFQIGSHAFGLPSRITATTRLGSGEVVDIQREVKLGGAIHSKGVLILSSLLSARYAREQPLSLSASLGFEQTYGTVDGDSASLAEFCVLLSSLAEVPIRQDFAVTGSIDQHGDVQAIGGVNEKIEGFFDVCRSRGLSGSQGVIVPASNVRHLMLRPDVVAAVEAGDFRVHAVATVDEAILLLTGMPVGVPGADGKYPEGTFNRRVADRLQAMTSVRRDFVSTQKPAGEST